MTRAILTVFHTTFLILEFVALLLNDFSLATALRLINFLFMAYVYYIRHLDYNRVNLSWYIFLFAVTDTIFYLFILIFITRYIFLYFLLFIAIARIILEYLDITGIVGI